MSGHKVVSLLEERGDVFIHGGPLRRRKGTAIARERLQQQQQGDLPSAAAASSSSNNNNNNLVEFVVGTKCTYKIRTRGGLGINTTDGSGDGGGGGEGGSGNKGDGEVFDFDADAMMHAAQRGEDIPTAIRKAEAAARAANRKRQAAAALIKMRESNTTNKDGSNYNNNKSTTVDDQQQLQQEEEEALATVDALVSSPQGEADLTALKIRQGKNMLDVMWAQEHCFVKCITPLTSVEAEHELQKEREEEEKREREELFHLMHDDDEFTSIKQPKRDPSKIHGGGAVVMDKYATTITGGVPANISPNDTRINEGLVNGFVIHFFNPMKPHPKPYEHLTETGKAFANTLACGRHASTPALPSEFYTVSHPALRTRMYLSQTQYEQEEWCLVYRTALLNYWHERLEASIISAPEIFQYQVFGVDIGGNVSTSSGNGNVGGMGGGGGGGSGKPIRSVGCPVHIVLSTSALYLVPRGTKEEFERDDVMKTKRMPLEALTMVSVDKAAGTVWISGGPLRGNNNSNKSTTTSVEGVPVGFYSPGEAYDFVLELQRVWELAGCASGDAKFPYTIVTPSSSA